MIFDRNFKKTERKRNQNNLEKSITSIFKD